MKDRTRTPRALLAASAVFLLPLLTWSTASAASAATVRVGAPAALPPGARRIGEVSPERELHLSVALRPQDAGPLEDFATEVSTPGSPVYHHYLGVTEFAERFGAPATQVAAVRRALVARGLSVGPAGANRLSLPVAATVAEAETAFGVSIDRVRLADGRTAYANDRAPAIPVTAAPFVEGVIGLADLATPHREGVAPPRSPLGPTSSPLLGASAAPSVTPAVATGGPQPCQAALAEQGSEGGYTADQIAAAYQFSGLYDAGDQGAGQTIALLELEPYSESDIAEYQGCFGTDVAVTPVDIDGGPGEGSDGESALDIEQLIGLAPAAHILVYQAPNEGNGEYDIFNAWVEGDVAKVMSSSWGLCEKETEEPAFRVTETLLQEAAAQGQSLFVSAGDAGSSDCFHKPSEEEIKQGAEPDLDESLSVDTPAGQPFATAVGGTRLQAPTAPPTEYIWNDGEEGGAGGGGISAHFAMPSYQSGAAPALGVINPYSSGAPCGSGGLCRQVPDVSADASAETGYVVYTEGEWEVAGGTSAAAPLWAAFAALTNASPACQGHPIGFADPALYSIAGSAYSANFHDITGAKPGGLPTNNMFGAGNPFPPAPGYDMATGLGSPIAPALAASLCAIAAPAPPASAAAPQSTPAPAPAAPAPPAPAKSHPGAVSHASLSVAGGKPRLAFSLTARSDASLTSVKVKLPSGLAASTSPGELNRGVVVTATGGKRVPVKVTAAGGSLRISIAHAVPAAQFGIGSPAIAAEPKLSRRVRGGGGAKLRFALAVGETGGGSSRYTIVTKP